MERIMSEIKSGGPAFPSPKNALDPAGPIGGMTLRDYFAAKAMQGAFNSPIESSAEGKDYIAMHAYKMADAMLKARSQS
jgi:hypothetical protein